MNGQPQRPRTWKEWIAFLEQGIKETEISLEMMKAQLDQAKKHEKDKE